MLNAVDLRVNNLPGYNWIGDRFPVLSWKISGKSGTIQQYYRILAASSTAMLKTPDLWDSGWVKSDCSNGIRWGGAKLRSRQQIFWQVEVRDQYGNNSGLSEAAGFETALLNNSDWKARWIFFDGNNPATSAPCPYFRREFELKSVPERAVLYVTARGLFEARING